jgi:Pyrimidine dimer DNA glycosylase
MQTFLPYPDLKESVRVLDYRRLGKQRVETFQILNILLDRTPTKGWRNHPVTLMWSGYEAALQMYQNYTIQEWIDRGYKNTMLFEEFDLEELVMPKWFGLEKFHRSHRSNLLRKDYEYYSQYFNEDINLEYYWPPKEVCNAN